MASYDGATLKVTKLFRMGHSTANVCLWRLHDCMLDYIHLSATGVAEMAECTNFKGCPHTFVYLVYVCSCVGVFFLCVCECLSACVCATRLGSISPTIRPQILLAGLFGTCLTSSGRRGPSSSLGVCVVA